MSQTFLDESQTVENFGRCYFFYGAEGKLCRQWFPSGGRILDVGCGAGRTTLLLHEAGYQVVGVDLSFAMLAHMKRRFPYLHAGCMNAAALPFPDASFDGVLFSYNGLSFVYPIESRKKAILEIQRVLRPGAHFIFSSHNTPGIVLNMRDRSLRTISERCFALPMMFRTGYVYEKKLQSHVYYSTVGDIIRELCNAGFSWVGTLDRYARFGRRIAAWIDPWPYHCFRRIE